MSRYLIKFANVGSPILEVELLEISTSKKYWKVINLNSDKKPFWLEMDKYEIIEQLDEDI